MTKEPDWENAYECLDDWIGEREGIGPSEDKKRLWLEGKSYDEVEKLGYEHKISTCYRMDVEIERGEWEKDEKGVYQRTEKMKKRKEKEAARFNQC